MQEKAERALRCRPPSPKSTVSVFNAAPAHAACNNGGC